MASPGDRIRALVDRTGAVTNRVVARALRVSPATAHRLLRALVVAGSLELEGKGAGARYRFPRLRHRLRLAGLEEDRVWERVDREIATVRPLDPGAAQSFRYAATEILNNAIEHSEG